MNNPISQGITNPVTTTIPAIPSWDNTGLSRGSVSVVSVQCSDSTPQQPGNSVSQPMQVRTVTDRGIAVSVPEPTASYSDGVSKNELRTERDQILAKIQIFESRGLISSSLQALKIRLANLNSELGESPVNPQSYAPVAEHQGALPGAVGGFGMSYHQANPPEKEVDEYGAEIDPCNLGLDIKLLQDEMSVYTTRLQTLNDNWANKQEYNTKSVANAGFFLRGTTLQCFACKNMRIKASELWDEKVSPYEWHSKFDEDQRAQRAGLEADRVFETQIHNQSDAPSHEDNQSDETLREDNLFVTLDTNRAQNETEYSSCTYAQALLNHIKQKSTNTDSSTKPKANWQIAADSLKDKYKEQLTRGELSAEVFNCAAERIMGQGLPFRQVEDAIERIIAANKKRLPLNLEPIASTPKNTGANQANMEENPQCCLICLEENKPLVVLWKCGHFNSCGACTGKLKKCPVCRQVIIQSIVPVEPETTCGKCKNKPAVMLYGPCKHLVYCKDCDQKQKDCPSCKTSIQQRLETFR